jgi:catechol 2,3-dioxygenase-like lactoylglutathione lyase family enzyme
MTTRVEHAQLLVSDLDRSAEFYTSLFPDWRVRARGREIGARPYAWIHVGTDETYLAFRTAYEGRTETSATVEKHSNHIGIVIDDVEATVKRLRRLGAETIVNEHPYRTRVYTRDPDGYELELVFYSTSDVSLKNDYALSVQAGMTVLDGV